MKKKIASAVCAVVLTCGTAAAPIAQSGISLLPVLTASASEQGYVYGDLYYKINGSEITITGYDWTAVEVDIPDYIDGLPVTKIAEEAFTARIFSTCYLESVTIGDNVKTIGSHAFDWQTSLTDVSFGSGLTTIEPRAFSNCTSLKDPVFGPKLRSVGEYAFAECISINSISLPDSVTYLGDNAFDSCTMMTTVKLPKNLGEIRSNTFYNCKRLSKITFPTKLETIGENAFRLCSSLTQVTIPKGTKTISADAFSDCPYLNRVNIPKSVTNIGDCAFGFSNQRSTQNWNLVIGCYQGSAGDKYALKYGFYREYFANSISDTKITVSNVTYNGYLRYPKVTVKDGKKTLVNGVDYWLQYNNNLAVGKGSVTVNGMGSYTGKKTASFIIKPAKTTVKRVETLKKGTAKVVWKRDKQASGYQIILASNSSFTKNRGSMFIKKNSTTAKTVPGLRSKKTFYFKVRSYIIVNGKKYYGKCSNVFSIKVK